MPFRKTLFPFVAEAYKKGDLEGARVYTEQTIKYGLISLGVFLLGLGTFAREFILLFFGKAFFPALPLLYALLGVVLIMSCAQLLNVSLIAIDRVRNMTFIQILAVVVALTVGWFAVPTYQGMGAVAMLGATFLLILIGYMFLARKYLKASFKAVIKILVLAGAFIAVVSWAPGDFISRLLVFAAAEGGFLVALLAWKVVDQKELAFIAEQVLNPLRALKTLVK